jgi:plastocyanin
VRHRAAAALVAAACLAVPAAAASGASVQRVKVGDDYYGPTKLTVKAGTKVRWVWLADNGDSHDVKLVKAPHAVKRFHSASAATDYTFTRKLTKRGTYKIVCTLHQDMTMSIRVR